MVSRADILAGAAFVRLYLQKADFVTGMAEAALRLRSFGGALSVVGGIAKAAAMQVHKVTDAVATLGKRVAIVGASLTGAILGTAKHFKDFGSVIADMSERTGIATEALSQLAYAAGQSGTSIEELETAIKHMQNRVAEKGIVGTAGLPADQQLEVIADQIEALEDPAQRTALAIDIFGRAGTRMLPMLVSGRAGIRALRMEADALGLTMLERDAKAADALGDAWDRLKDTALGLAFNTGAALAQSLTKLFDLMSSVIGAVSRWVKENQALVRVLVVVSTLAAAMGASLFVFAKFAGVFVKLLASVLALATVLKVVLKLLAFAGLIGSASLAPVLAVVAAIAAALTALAGGVLLLLAARFERASNAIIDGLRNGILRATVFIFDTIKNTLERLPATIARALESGGGLVAAMGRIIRRLFTKLWPAIAASMEALVLLAKDAFDQLPKLAGYAVGLIVREFAIGFFKLHNWMLTSTGDLMMGLLRMWAGFGPKLAMAMTTGNIGGIVGQLTAAMSAAMKGAATGAAGLISGLGGMVPPEFRISPETMRAYQRVLAELGRGGGGLQTSPGQGGSMGGSAFVTYSASALGASGRGAAIDRLVRIAELHKELTREGAGHTRDLKKEFKRIADGLRH